MWNLECSGWVLALVFVSVNWFFWYFKQPFIGCWRGDKSSTLCFQQQAVFKVEFKYGESQTKPGTHRRHNCIWFTRWANSECFFSPIRQLSSMRWRECSWKSRRRRRKRRRSMPKCSPNYAIVNNSDKQLKLNLHGRRHTQMRRL